jgi:signal transduction histidine kinase/CheY-like chemotaxis protein
MIVRDEAAGGFVRANNAFLSRVGFSDAELADKSFREWLDPRDHEAWLGLDGMGRVRHRTRDGGLLSLRVRKTEHQGRAMLLGHGEIAPVPVEADGDGVDEATVCGTLDTIARIVEEQNPGYRCSILLVADGRFVRGAGPSLPEEYNAAIDGFAIGPAVGSCGTAIYWNVPVVVEDIQADPLWAPFAELAARAGVAACWSHPFMGRSGTVLGALALYSPEPRAPSAGQRRALRAAARMTGLAVERGRAEEALRKKRARELELEEQLRQAAKMEALGVLAGGVAHDFNNVLGSILANAELALDVSPPDMPAVDLLTDIVRATRRAGDFCKQMLAYAGRGSLTASQFDIGALIPELDGLVRAALSKKATLEYSLHQEPVFVEGDENQLLQVVMNLVTNAAEALGDREGRIVVGTTVAHYGTPELQLLSPKDDLDGGDYVRITVSDTGCGMSPETIARIFDPFYTTKFTGRGLGLAAVRGIVRHHRGTIRIESEVGKGTTFTVLLPTTTAVAQSEPDRQSSVQHVAIRRVLLADDEKVLRMVIRKRLEFHGFEVTDAADGQEAIDIFTEDPDAIDCVILDLSMPRRSGEEVYRALREQRSDIPVILMSGFDEDEVARRFDGAQVVATLQKPVAADELLAALRKASQHVPSDEETLRTGQRD